MANITNLRQHLSLLVNAYDADDKAALADIIASARETLGRGRADNDNGDSRDHLFSGRWVYIHLGGLTYSLIDRDDFALVEPYYWAPTGRLPHLYANGQHADGRYVQMHRLILSAPRGLMVDHINGNGLDNRRCNLRLATASQNAMNKKTGSNNTSGHKGVGWSKRENRWIARIKVDGKDIRIGSFLEIEKAVSARIEAEKEYHGEFARRA